MLHTAETKGTAHHNKNTFSFAAILYKFHISVRSLVTLSSHPHPLLSLVHLLKVVFTLAHILLSSPLKPFHFLTSVSTVTCFFFVFIRTEVSPRTASGLKETEAAPGELSLLPVFARWITIFCGHGRDGQRQLSRLPKLIHCYRKYLTRLSSISQDQNSSCAS